ncbi:glyoxalase [Cryobacterium melibiosiphilum]|uniref:Glyoxalase n=1 Tax=Cryobacterium melibiosiphilum TaxID=995039 RepID=A0A3A5MI86_9MICO|nr:VOC family protein [Cryobacterium melibiosiphilum]RJT85627.1 glyoxalase [Cryobacterium melibiosiphilum]
MVTSIFVNFSTRDLDRAKAFYEGLGWSINPNFTDENAACIVIDENVFLMVLTREFFQTFSDKPIGDPLVDVQVQTAFSRDSREEVDEILEKAIKGGGTEQRTAQDYGFMYSRDFEDPDGNLLSALWMDPVAAEIGPEAYMAQQSTDA